MSDDIPQVSSPQTLRLGDFLPYRLSVLSNTVSSSIADIYSDAFDLTIWQWRCMAVLGETPGLTARELTKRTAMDKVAVSRAVAGLEAAGRLERTEDPTDRRASRLSLTEAGRTVYAKIVPLALSYEAALVSGLSQHEQDQLKALLNKLAQAANGSVQPLW